MGLSPHGFLFVFAAFRAYASGAVPDHRDIYILAAGVLAGILLGPQVLGRLVPPTYERWFRSVEQAQDNVAAYRRELTESTTALSLEEFRDQHQQRLAQLAAELKQAHRARARLTYVVLMLLGVCTAEVLASRPTVARSLARARYVLLAAGAMLILAQPYVAMTAPARFIAGLAAVCVIACLIGTKRHEAERSAETETEAKA